MKLICAEKILEKRKYDLKKTLLRRNCFIVCKYRFIGEPPFEISYRYNTTGSEKQTEQSYQSDNIHFFVGAGLGTLGATTLPFCILGVGAGG